MRIDDLSPRNRLALLVSVSIGTVLILALLAEGLVRLRALVKHGNFERIEDTYVFDEAANLRVVIAEPFAEDLRELVDVVGSTGSLTGLVTFSTQLRHEQTLAERKRAATTSMYYMPYMSIDDLLLGFAT